MTANQMLTVRIPEEDLEKLDQLAAIQGRPRSQLVQEALAELISKNENLRDLEVARLKKRLKTAIAEQCKLIDESGSFSDDNRTF
ncbi:MAG: ribbon-helix-helix domain-containing protein [Granulosicoccus sp.]